MIPKGGLPVFGQDHARAKCMQAPQDVNAGPAAGPFSARPRVSRWSAGNEEHRMRLAMISSAVIAAAGALVLGVWSHGLAAPSSMPRFAQDERPVPPRAAADVDVELVLAVDVSYSMDPDEQALQRERSEEHTSELQ